MSVLELLENLGSAGAAQQALAQAFAWLQSNHACAALVLELTEGVATRLFPLGDPAAIDAALSPSAPAETGPRVSVSFPDTQPVQGTIRYAFAPAAEPDVRLLEVLTAQIALRFAYEAMQQRVDGADAQAQRRLREVAVLYDIGQAIQPGAAPRLLQMLVDRTTLLMDAQACSIMLMEPARDRLRLAASHGLPRDIALQTQLIGEGIAGRVAQTEQPLLLVDAARNDPRLEGVALKPNIGCSMLVPMKDQSGQVLGVLSIRRRRPAPDFTDEDLKLFSVFASQAALALTNLRLYEDVNRRAGELLKISSLSRALLSTIDLETLLHSVVEDVCQVVGFDRCCLFLRDNARPLFVPRFWRGYADTIARNPVKQGEGAVGLAARNKTMQLFDRNEPVTPEQEAERSYLQLKGFARALGAQAFVAIPILTGKETCIGVLVADNKLRRACISPEQKTLLQAFVSQAGIAIENAILYEQMQENVVSLRRLKDYTENVIQSIEAAILTTDAQGCIVRCNRAAEETFGVTAREARDMPLGTMLENMLLPVAECEHLVDLVARVQETGERVHRLKLTLHPRDRAAMTVYLMLARLPEHKAGRKAPGVGERAGVVLIFEDVTQEVMLEAEVGKMRRLADIGQLAAKMAHEVRNALSPIKAAAQMMRDDLIAHNVESLLLTQGAESLPSPAPDAPDCGDGLETGGAQYGSVTEWPDIIIAEVEGLSRLTGEMLDFARPTPLDLRPLEINAFLRKSTQALTRFLTEHRVKIQWRLARELPPLQADEIQLGQVVRNIVMNAAQSMPEGGALRIGTEWDETWQMLCLSFQDTGVGIPPEDQERIFRPFVTTRPKGTGLGLPIVQKIVNQHGGRVEVQSDPGKGTCFSIYLPLLPPAASPEHATLESPLISSRPAGNYPDK